MEKRKEFVGAQGLLEDFYLHIEKVNAAILNQEFSPQELKRLHNECAWTQKLAAGKMINFTEEQTMGN